MSLPAPTVASAAVSIPAAPAGETARSAGRAARWREGVVLLTALIAFTVALAPALRESATPPGWDQANHLRDALVYERLMRDPLALTPEKFRAILKGSDDYPLITPSGYYPPLVPAVTALVQLAAGRSYGTAMATQILFLALLLGGIWGLGNRLAGPPAGLVAALLTLAAPGIRLNAAEYMLDLPLAALVVASAWALLATEGFSRRGASIGFGALVAAGMLIKWSFLLFLAVPLAMAVGSSMGAARRQGESALPRWINLGLAISVAAILMAPYYAPILPILIRKTVVHAGGAADGFTSPLSWASARFHLESLPRKLLGWPLTLTVAAGILLSFRRGALPVPSRRFLGLWIASLYLVFTFVVTNKQSRYLLPWLPLLFLLAAAGILHLGRGTKGDWARPAGAFAAALLLLPLPALAGDWRGEEKGDWKLDRIVDALAADLTARPPARPARLAALSDMRQVNGPTLYYYASRRDLPVTVVQVVNRMKRHVAMEVGLDPFDRGDFYETFSRFDYVLTKTGDNAVPPWEEVVPALHRYFEERRGEFVELIAVAEPDGSTVRLYRRVAA